MVIEVRGWKEKVGNPKPDLASLVSSRCPSTFPLPLFFPLSTPPWSLSTLASLATFPTHTLTHNLFYFYLALPSLLLRSLVRGLYPTLAYLTVPLVYCIHTSLCLCRFCCSLRLLFDPSFFSSSFPGYGNLPRLSIIPV